MYPFFMGQAELHAIQESAKKLVEAVDVRETDKTDEKDEKDWSERVDRAIKNAYFALDKIVVAVRNELPEAWHYSNARLKDFQQELNRIRQEIESKQALDVEVVIQDILDDFEKSPGYNEIDKKAYLAMGRGALDSFDAWRNEPWTKEVFINAIQEEPYDLTQNLKKYSDVPWLEEAFLSLLDNPKFDYLIRDYALYKEYSWAASVFKKALEKVRGVIDVYSAFDQYEYFKNESEPWLGNLLRSYMAIVLADEDSSIFLFYKEIAGQPWADQFLERDLKRTLEKKPLAFLEAYPFIKEKSWAQAHIKEAVDNAMKGWASKVWHYFAIYINEPWGPDILEKSIKEGARDTYEAKEILENKKKLERFPWAKEVIQEATETVTRYGDDIYFVEKFFDDNIHQEGALDIAKNIIANRGTDELWKKFDVIKTKPWAKELVAYALQEHFEHTFRYVDTYVHEPWAEEVIRANLPKRDYQMEYFYNNIQKIKHATWFQKLLGEINEKYPRQAVQALIQCSDLPWASEALQKECEKDPTRVVWNYKDLSQYPWAKPLFKKGLELEIEGEYSTHVTDRYPLFKDEPWAEAILKKAAEAAMKKERGTSLIRELKDVPYSWASPMRKKVCEKIVVRDPEVILEHHTYFKDEPWAESVIKSAVENLKKSAEEDRYRILTWKMEAYVQYSWAKSIVEELLEKEPGLVLFYQDYMQTSWGKDILKKAAFQSVETDPVPALRQFYSYEEEPWALEVLKKAYEHENTFKDDVSWVFVFFKKYEKQPWVKQVFIKAAEINPLATLQNYEKYKNQPWAADIALAIAEGQSAYVVLELCSSFKKAPWAEEVIKKAIKKGPDAALQAFNNYSDMPWSRSALKLAAEQCAEKIPPAAIDYYHLYEKEPWGDAALKQAFEHAAVQDLRKVFESYEKFRPKFEWMDDMLHKAASIGSSEDPDFILYQAPILLQFDWAEGLIKTAASNAPGSVFYAIEGYKKEPWTYSIVKIAVKKSPFIALSYARYYRDLPWAEEILAEAAYLFPTQAYENRIEFKEIFEKSQAPVFQALRKIQDMNEILAKSGRVPYENLRRIEMQCIYFVEKIIKGEWTSKKLFEVVQDDGMFFHELHSLYKQDEYAGRESVEVALMENSLRMVRTMNDLHDSADNERFKAAEKMSPSDMYLLVVFGSQEVFTSTFQGLFKRLMEKMQKDGMNGYDLLHENNFKGFRKFLNTCTSYNKLEAFLDTMTEVQQKEVLEKFIDGLAESEDRLSESVMVVKHSCM